MKYKCPSCKMRWQDALEPKEQLSQPLCIFCSGKHTEKELLNWQMDHIKDISPDDLPTIIRHFYRYVERTIKTLQGEMYDITRKPTSDGGKEDNSR